jgi:hypothetical protein
MITFAKIFVAVGLLLSPLAFSQTNAEDPAGSVETGPTPMTDSLQGTNPRTGEGTGAITTKKAMKKVAPFKKDLKKEKRGPVKAPPAENGNIED